MLSIVLEFKVVEGKDEEFIRAWTKCTEVIYQNFQSLGSRLHRSETGSFIAYAQWPDQATYDKSGEWPSELVKYRENMRKLLIDGKPRVLHKLSMEVDLLNSKIYNNA
ncbi:hypothetical protein [Kangiella sp. M94]